MSYDLIAVIYEANKINSIIFIYIEIMYDFQSENFNLTTN